NRTSSTTRPLSLGAVCGYTTVRFSMNPRCSNDCASNTAARTPASITAQSLQSEFVVLHRQVVFELFVLQNRAALTSDVVHLGQACRPYPFDLLVILIVDRPHQALFAVSLDLHEGVIIFLDPEVGILVLRRFTWTRF